MFVRITDNVSSAARLNKQYKRDAGGSLCSHLHAVPCTVSPDVNIIGLRHRSADPHRAAHVRTTLTNIWNSLPEDIVTAPSVYSIKNRLDKYWHNQELVYNWQTEITGTGSRSKFFS